MQGNEDRSAAAGIEMDEVGPIIEKHRKQRGGLIAILGDIQARYGYLPEPALRMVSGQLGHPLEEIYGVATFYRSFSLAPRGKHHVCACLGTACHVRGAQRIVDELERKLGIQAGQTTPDGEFSLETVNCLGACALGPVVVADGHYHSKVRKSGVGDLLERAAQGGGSAEANGAPAFVLNACCPRCQSRLEESGHLIENHPAIRLDAACRGRHGWIRLSSVYGSRQIASEFPIPAGSVVEFQCPHCHIALPISSRCWECDAPVASLQIAGGGKWNLCCRRGCPQHLLEIS